MNKNTKFFKYFQSCLKYQNKSLPNNKLSKDYIIIYDYLMDLLKEDKIISKILVCKKQKESDINADVLLDLKKLYNISRPKQDPFLCLTCSDKKKNCHLEGNGYPFCDEKLSILPNKITKYVWQILKKGLTSYSPFVRGCQGDIYELSISSEESSEYLIRITAYNDEVVLHATLRILIKYCKMSKNNFISHEPYPIVEPKTDWLAVVPKRKSSMFEICLPIVENTIKNNFFEFANILRLMRFLFDDGNDLYNLDLGFITAIVYSEFFENFNCGLGYRNFLFQRILFRIFKIFKTKTFPYFWNTDINLMECIDETTCAYIFSKANSLLDEYNLIKNKVDVTCEEVFSFLELNDMDTFSYEVDQFGIFKLYKDYN